MPQKNYHVLGVMSGTSIDGVDLANIRFTISDGGWDFEICECETVPYSHQWINTLKSAIGFDAIALKMLNSNYTELLGNIIFDFIKKHRIQNLDAVCSHGHTIMHRPQEGYTLQIGNLSEITKIARQTVVCDFRVADVRLGGQGAPLVPIGDRILFSEYDYCLNLGGFSNISFELEGERVAFDVSPVNTVLNFYSNLLGSDYDDRGKISKNGQLNKMLLDELNALAFYSQKPPKSLGLEFVRETLLPIIESYPIDIAHKMRTFTDHIAIQTALALREKKGKLLITGGGAYNDFLIERLKIHLPAMEIIIPDTKIIEFKEALVFGLLGVLKLRNEVNVLASVTGANQDHSSGEIYYP